MLIGVYKYLIMKKLKGLAKRIEKFLIEELENLNVDYDTAKARILDIKTVGVQGDQRTYTYPIEIEITKNGEFIWEHKVLEELSTKIPNQFREINRVLYYIK